MTEEERKELDTLLAKKSLTEEEQARVAELQAKAVPSDDNEFDETWKKLEREDSGQKSEESEEGDKDKKESQSKEGEEDQDGSIFNEGPEEDTEEEEDTPEAKIAALEAQLEKEKQRTSSWEGRIRAANKRAEEAEQKLQEGKGQDKGKKDDLPDDEPELKEFLEEFPSLEKPIKLMVQKLTNKLLDERISKLEPELQRVRDTLSITTQDTHLRKITEAHPDWRDIRDSGALDKWIEIQPRFVKEALERIKQEGDADEVIEMFDSYKKATGRLSDNTSERKQSPKKKLEGLEAVTHQPSTVNTKKGEKDKEDFDAAYEEALREDS